MEYQKTYMWYEKRNFFKELKKEVTSDDSIALVVFSVISLLAILYFSHDVALLYKEIF